MYTKLNDKIETYYEQCWKNPLSTTATASARKLYELYEQRVITKVDLNIINFLANFHIGTFEHICKAIDDYNEDNVRKRIALLLKNRLINQFMLHDGSEVKVREDAMPFYTIDQAGIVLLQLIDQDSNGYNFRLDTVVCNGAKVKRKLLANDFYFRLRDTLKGRLNYFISDPILGADLQRVYPKAVFGVLSKESNEILPFVLEAINSDDVSSTRTMTSFLRRITTLEKVQKTPAWKKYFNSSKEPLIFILCDTMETANNISGIISSSTECDYRVVVQEKFDNGFDKSFGKYKDGKLVFKKSKLFSLD